MGEIIRWAELTPAQRDRLVAEKVMGWQDKECEGYMLDFSFGWKCDSCDFSGGWGETYGSHPATPPEYTQGPIALEVLEQFPEATIHHWKEFPGGARYRVIVQDAGFCYATMRSSLSEAICIAALMAHGMDVQV
jgi:hypothetical protein